MVLCEQVNKLVSLSGRVKKAKHRGLSAILLIIFLQSILNIFCFGCKCLNATVNVISLHFQCELFHFYDNHDIWHFLSATSLFLNFMMLLTIDDDLHLKPREQIPVF